MIRVQTESFDSGAEIQALATAGVGAVVSFTGFVRDYAQNQAVTAIFLEYYPGMTERALERLESEARSRWSLSDVTLIHRVGELVAGEAIVLVAVASGHRREAFEAAQYLMDMLKTRAPFWKKERFTTGEAWVDANVKDAAMATRWDASSE